MRVNRSVGYGLIAVKFIAQSSGKKLVTSQAIAEKFNIPLEYLLKVMQQLVRAGIFRSKRGPTGGFSLARSISKISVLDVVRAIDGVPTMSLGFEDLKTKGNKFTQRLQTLYKKAEDQSNGVLAAAKLSDL